MHEQVVAHTSVSFPLANTGTEATLAADHGTFTDSTVDWSARYRQWTFMSNSRTRRHTVIQLLVVKRDKRTRTFRREGCGP